jgi:hypothetical protein
MKEIVVIALVIAYVGFLSAICWRYGLWPFDNGETPSEDPHTITPAEWRFPPKWHPPASEYVAEREKQTK